MPEATQLDHMPPCPSQKTVVATIALLVCHTPSHVHTAHVGLLSSMQHEMLGHRLPFPGHYSCSQPDGHPEEYPPAGV